MSMQNEIFIDSLVNIWDSGQPDVIRMTDIDRLISDIKEHRNLAAVDFEEDDCASGACKL